jgi:asparagine synthase (glutamine-hydrolysing)
MCGIAGYFGAAEIPEERRRDCLRLMGRRGPDASGETHHRCAGGRHLHLLHSRLSIIDLDDRANQPFITDRSRLVFNGEVYNYLELRSELRAYGARFDTESDTEVLARLLDERGLPALDACEGMWAFARFDERASELQLCRDRFGEKPLYLHQAKDGVYFGSEPKLIFALLGRRLPVNLQHLYRYLVNGYKALYKVPETFFVGLGELAPGTVARVDAEGRLHSERYWDPRVAETDEGLGFEEAVSGARQALYRSVELRLRADVPLAFCLSGGVDSNALIAVAKRHFGYDVHGFTIMNTDRRYEEREMVEASVSSLELRHTAVPIETRGFLPGLRRLLLYHDAPVLTITYFAQWQLMRAVAAAGYKVSVSGTAADELFSGYYDHHNAYLFALRDDPASLALAREAWQRQVAPLVRNRFLRDPDYFFRDPQSRAHIYLDAEEFSRSLTRPWQEPFAERHYCDELLRNRMANELFHESVPPILHEDDLNAMYYSIENRSPFLDRALFEWCQRIPTRHLVRQGRAKAVLREAVRGLAPDVVLDNPRKVGFNVPILDYLDVKDPEVRAQVLDEGPIFDHVRRDRIERMLDRQELPNSESKFLFYFLNSRIFLEELGS